MRRAAATTEEIQLFHELFARGETIPAIAARFGFGQASIIYHLRDVRDPARRRNRPMSGLRNKYGGRMPHVI